MRVYKVVSIIPLYRDVAGLTTSRLRFDLAHRICQMKNSAWKSIGLALVAALSLVSKLQAADASLYDRLGGQPAVQAVANGLVDRILVDDRVNKWFAHAASSPENATAYKAKLYDFV